MTIARLLVKQIISRHGAPCELLSDRGAAFLSSLMKDVCQVMGTHKVNTTAYHPQSDGLVERFNHTLIDMLSKTVDQSGRNWDEQLPFVLFAYWTSVQESTQESPFFLLYGRDPLLPSELGLSTPLGQCNLDLVSYKEELVTRLSQARILAKEHVKKAQWAQKRQYDKKSQAVPLRVGDRVFLHVPSTKQGKAYKFAKPFKGPFRVLEMFENGADIHMVDNPKADTIQVSLNRLRQCPRYQLQTQTLDPSQTYQTSH